ncbi:hypothetical protein FT663_03219 [Candidozyma haemuli var. vulneris]|uniref:Uncharacterized protein n=1 Tax=Candidozyma haemuli TaxID=45357 RepID=A0A2V1AV67_9ASCO|nr:hypothetical protein CXQ85_004676 [[Candida] haemuloni]KAF3988716.1 hypothetical protein FT662_03244 [[Candida] haemuloni var. vulneris]KAF3990366.1 hypothetical protein FT663_03219 [[Candida] haemuloni var. vulneris]PVH22010.1 hypothetical protein CXQ85_004676 [[Candida] haemuloni]
MPHFFIPTIPETYKKLRYKVNYFIVDTRSKWYSTSRNPRLVQSKFQGQTMITLRVHPHDKYLIKPGEFLSLEKKDPDTFSLNSFVDMYCQEMVDNMSFPDYEGSEKDEEEDSQEQDQDTKEAPKINSVDINEPPISPITRASNFIRSFSRSERKAVNMEKEESPKAPESPKTPESPITRKRDFYRRMLGIRRWEEEPLEESTSIGMEVSGDFSSPSPKVWRRVLSDISLSAAQISTGSAPSSRGAYENLSSDLTEGRLREVRAA